MTDFRLENHGSVYLLRMLSDDARDCADTAFGPDVLWFGDAIAVEPRYAADLVAALENDGYEVLA